MSEVHVLHVLNSAHGGSALSTFELIEVLKSKGIKSSLVCFNNASDSQKKKISDLVQGRVLFIPLYWMNKRIRVSLWKRPIIEIISIWKTWFGYKYQSRILSLIKNEGVNLIHTSTILNPEGAIASKKNNIPHLWHVRELIGPNKHFKFRNYSTFSKYVISNCRYLIANSFITEKCLLDFFPKDKIRCIPNGLRISNFVIKNHLVHKEKIVIGMVGSVTSRWKNHEFFIRTSALFLDRIDVEFKIYGSLPDVADSYYQSLLMLTRSLSVSVEFVQFKSPEIIMGEIDILFHPTDLESFGRIFIEAMSAGIPVVAVNDGGSLEMVKDGVNGFLVSINDTKQAADRISQLAKSPQLRTELSRNGRDLVEQKYTLDILGDRIANLYNEVIQ
jgi:L-malate glycosyltransferase